MIKINVINNNVSWTRIIKNPISYIDKKVKIMNLYESESSQHPFPRSEKNIRSLATFRGATAGVHYAESFIIVKEVIK